MLAKPDDSSRNAVLRSAFPVLPEKDLDYPRHNRFYQAKIDNRL